jgi:hypothetical protein
MLSRGIIGVAGLVTERAAVIAVVECRQAMLRTFIFIRLLPPASVAGILLALIGDRGRYCKHSCHITQRLTLPMVLLQGPLTYWHHQHWIAGAT